MPSFRSVRARSVFRPPERRNSEHQDGEENGRDGRAHRDAPTHGDLGDGRASDGDDDLPLPVSLPQIADRCRYLA